MVKHLALAILVTGCLSTPAFPLDGGGPAVRDAPISDGATSGLLVGDNGVSNCEDGHSGTLAEAASFTAKQSGTVDTLWILNDSPVGTTVFAALYSNDETNVQPGAVLTQASAHSQNPPEWTAIRLTQLVHVTAGTLYWIAAKTGAGSTISFFYRYLVNNGNPCSTASTESTCDPLVDLCTLHDNGAVTPFHSPWITGATYPQSTNYFYASGAFD